MTITNKHLAALAGVGGAAGGAAGYSASDENKTRNAILGALAGGAITGGGGRILQRKLVAKRMAEFAKKPTTDPNRMLPPKSTDTMKEYLKNVEVGPDWYDPKRLERQQRARNFSNSLNREQKAILAGALGAGVGIPLGAAIQERLRQLERDTYIDQLMAKEGAIDMGKAYQTLRSFGMKTPKSLLGMGSKLFRHAKGVVGNTERAAERVFHPIEGMRKGWREMSGLGQLESMPVGKAMELLKKSPHLNKPLMGLGKAYQSGGAKGIAEELSRAGWTGMGPRTKYLPVGSKAWPAAFGAMAVPDIVNAPDPSPTGEGAALERGIGELAGLGGWIAGTGVGLIPGAALWYAANKAGSGLGRVLDRYRSGADLWTAMTAPSPREAAEQLTRISEHYGMR